MTLVSVIMPALDEAENIESVVRGVPVDRLAALGYETEILVVDNGSADGTDELARKAGAQVVSEPRRGYGRAYLKGFAEASGSIICTMDADGTYPAEMLPELVAMLPEEGLDFINTDRFATMTNGVMSRMNKWGNSLLSLTARSLFQLPFRDSQSGMWVFKSELLERMRLTAGGMALSEEIKIEAALAAQGPLRRGLDRLRLPARRVEAEGLARWRRQFRVPGPAAAVPANRPARGDERRR